MGSIERRCAGVKVTVRDKYWECDTVYNDVIRIEEGHRTFKLIKNGGFSKEFDNERFSYTEERGAE